MKCTICKHPDREKIDEAIIGGKSIRQIVDNFGGTSRETVRRHTKHVLAIVRKHDEIQQLAHAGSLKAKLIMREADLLRIQQQAEINKDLPTAISAIRELRQCHELQAKVEGQLKPQEVAVVAVNLDEETSRRVAQTCLQRHPKEQHQDDEL
jgi:hypothetical protein